ncbi:unnamed protein product, partial [Prorocentrum cordatum]
ELEYTLTGEEGPYVATKVNRFRCSWQVLHLMHSFWRVAETTRSVHAALNMPGVFGLTKKITDLEPEDIQTAILKMHEKGKKLLRRDGIAYALRFGPPLVSLTPNLADTTQPLLLVEMVQRLARDHVGQTLVFELLLLLFFVHVLGIRSDLVGWRRGAARKSSRACCFDSCAVDFYEDSIASPVSAAFGAIEAQGRGSLHPRILVWLVLISMRELLDTLVRDRATLKERVALWMRELAHALKSVQEFEITGYAGFLGGNLADPLPPELEVGELPLGLRGRGQFGADGEVETVSAERLNMEESKGDQKLYFWCPDKIDEDPEQEARRPKLGLRDEQGNDVDLETGRAEQLQKRKSLWSTPLHEFASGEMPSFLLGHSAQSVMEQFRQALPSDDWIKEVCTHGRDLVIGCAVHICSPSCFEYQLKGSSKICRHHFYRVVNL